VINEHRAAALALLAAVAAPDWPRLAASARWAVEARLSERVVPAELVAHLTATGDAESLRHLVSSHDAARDHPAVRARVAAGPPADAWRAMTGKGFWTYRDWELLIARCDPDSPVWRDIEEWEVGGRLHYALTPVLALSPLWRHYHFALARAAERLTLREQAHALVSVQRDAGVGEVAAVIERHDLSIRDRALEALAGEGIEALAAELDTTAAAITELRAAEPREADYVARERAGLDWPLIAEAHAAEPFAPAAATALAAREDCPDELRTALFAAHPAEVAGAFPHLPADFFSLPLKGSARTKAVRALTARFLTDGRVAELVEHAHPAAQVLEASRRADPIDPLTWKLQPVHTVVGGILARTVGTDVGAWRALRRLLKRHKGTIAELCETATASPDRDGTWPDAEPLPSADAKPSLTGTRKAFVVLLDAAGVDTQLALLPHLDDRTAADLFTHGVFRREWFAHVVEKGTPNLRLAFTRTRGTLDVQQIQRLLDLDEPELAGALALRRPMTAAQITHIMSGKAFPGGGSFPEALRTRFLAATGGWTPRHAIACADPEVQRHILRHVRVRGIVPQLRLLLDLWERDGKSEMLALVQADLDPLKYTRAEFQGGVVKRMRKLAAAEDEGTAKGELGAYLAERETAEWQIQRLQGGDTFHRESHDWFFEEIAKAEGERRLGVLDGVRASPGGERLDEHLKARADSGSFPSKDVDDTRRLIAEGIGAGTLTWAEIFAEGSPAAHVLAAANDDATERWLPGLRAVVGRLDLDAEAQLVALGMLRDFAGTVPELLATAVGVTGS